MSITLSVPVTSGQAFLGTRDQVAAARAWALAAVPLPRSHPRASDLATVVTELATNAIRHSMSGARGGRYCLQVSLDPGSTAERGAVELTCVDLGPGAGLQDEREDACEGGRGLRLVRALVDAYSADQTPTSREVRCRLIWGGGPA
ncbi:anti-sigma regulatory factor (Ser/Thr protein kinase) [Nonomuraea thailandensis]|uniref:Anti-sigma regulatory factor (Ser/Thr protein kinase) n=1 Tax=Nonomuraea thailandensis TaxID=1188745 RepID=A0A9X2KAG0_9ACTN|nr:ATP-binding protein [Nonomuraea thailandensis]MCP2365785.1 anti-sigma regulatory factor (Ser/Thr protein kinase) [Nonomuraea thailandensis]